MLHEHSRRDASDIMGIDIKRLDKIMVAANKKLGGMLEAINRGHWCQDQRSLIKAYALGLHEQGGERHALALAHVMECQACAAYVRSLRGLSAAVPAPALLASAAGAGGGVAGALGALLNGGASSAAVGGAGAAGGGGGAALLSGIGAKTVALCASAICAAGGAMVLVDRAPDKTMPSAAVSANRAARSRPPPSSSPTRAPTATSSRTHRSSRRLKKRTSPDPNAKGAQEIAEFGIESQATLRDAPAQVRAASIPRPPAASEFGIGP